MKPNSFIGIIVLWALACCTPSVKAPKLAAPEPAAPKLAKGPSPALSAIDSLMWQQPDSALARLLDYWADSSAAMRLHNRHYAHLLTAELLYKNDYAQTNRAELQQAVAYFDSLIFTKNDTQHPPHRHCGLDPQSPNQNDVLFFLAARAHYINGVGYYERDSVVEACAEYLKALETMEGRFDEKALTGHRARFMAYTYNRLGELFSGQFMMESAIDCGNKALVFCRLEPTSSEAVPNNLIFLGKQYDKMNKIDSARHYYVQALEELGDTNNLVYRNIIASKALCDYQNGMGMSQPIGILEKVLMQAADDNERATRFLTIGAIFFAEKMYDSALFYLEPLFDNKKDESLRINAAESLRIIYDYFGNDEKSNECMRYISLQNKAIAEDKALVSKLDDMYKNYQDQLQKKVTEIERGRAVKKAVIIIIPIAILVALTVAIVLILINRRVLKEQQEEADKRHTESIEAERQIHRMEQAAIAGRLKRSNQEVQLLREQVKSQKDSLAATELASTFADDPICLLIRERVNNGQFLSQMDCTIYRDYALDKDQLAALRNAANRHFNQFTLRLGKAYPELTRADLDYCCLYLLGLTDADVAALMQRAYNTVNERSNKIRRILDSETAISTTLQLIASEAASH